MKRFIPILIIGVCGGLFMIYTMVSQNSLVKQLDANGKTTVGLIEGGSEKDGSVELNITYTPESGTPITKDFPVSGDLKAKLMKDGKIAEETVEIRYLPSDPDKSRVVGQFTPGMAGLVAGVAITLFSLLLLIFILTRKPKVEA